MAVFARNSYRILYRIQTSATLKVMHEIQKNLLALARLGSIDDLSYRQIAERIGCEHASQVKHHMEQLIKHGYLVRNANGQLLAMGEVRKHDSNVVTVPILGEADCGEATRYATDEIRGYLTVSPSVLKCGDIQGLYALKACGDSMDNARVNDSKQINDGDYVLVKKCGSTEVRDGDYVVSIIQGLANIKRLRLDAQNHRIVLLPESHRPYPPVIIAEEDVEAYEVSGKVVDVVPGVERLALR